jgi:hypothetical protein
MRHRDLDAHDGFEDLRLRALEGLREGVLGGHSECR